MIYLTSDSHLGHANILKYTNRPFASVEEMDAALIANWNRVVGPDDEVYHLGDFCFGKSPDAAGYFARLNGLIYLLRYPFHHDRYWSSGLQLFKSATGRPIVFCDPITVLELPEYGLDRPQCLVLCHYPLRIWERAHYGAWHAFGHVHHPEALDGLAYNVGVDLNNFTPLSLPALAAQMLSKGWYPGLRFV